MTAARFDNIASIKTFMFAGNSRFTIKSLKTGVRFTYRVAKSDDGKLFFLSVLTGPDNMSDYTYLGTIRGDRFTHGRKSSIGIDAPSTTAFIWFWNQLVLNKFSTMVEFWHEGRCGRCSRVLTDPVSISSGFGPECINHVPALKDHEL